MKILLVVVPLLSLGCATVDELPTQNEEAYNLYLEGNEIFRRSTSNIGGPSRAGERYWQAVQLDPEFGLAWAGLVRANVMLYFFGADRSDQRIQMAEDALQRAQEFAPDTPEVQSALGYYYYQGIGDYARAAQHFAEAQEGMPNNVDLYETRAYLYRRMGEFRQSVAAMERAIALDPMNFEQLAQQALTYEFLREYSEAEKLYDQILGVSPGNRVIRGRKEASIPLWRDGVSVAALGEPLAPCGPWQVALYTRDYDLALDVLRSWGSEEGAYSWALNQYVPIASFYGVTYALAGEMELADQYFQKARAHLEEALTANPGDHRLHIALGEALAGLGDSDGAVESARRALEIMPTSRDTLTGPRVHVDAIVRVFGPAGDADAAIEALDDYLAAPGEWSVEGLVPDPRLDSIREDPRFQTLVEKYRRTVEG